MGSITAHFTITGEFIARTARNLMLEDDPGKAWRLLADCLIGNDNGIGAADVARKVLAGDADLIGDSVRGVSVVHRGSDGFDAGAADEYLDDLRYIYAGRFRHQGRWYRPRSVVVAYGPDDAKAAGECRGKDGIPEWQRRRAKYYAEPGSYVAVCRCDVDIDGTPADASDRRGYHVIFEPCGELPQWWTPPADAQAALDAWLTAGHALEHVGYQPDDSRPQEQARTLWGRRVLTDEEIAEQDRQAAVEDAYREAEAQRIGERVRDAAGDDVFDLTLLDGRVIKVPRAPFLHWAFRGVDRESRPELPAWTTVSDSGWKMYNDDPNHTDWVLGSGLTLAEAYEQNVTRPAYAEMMNLQIEAVDRD